MLHMMIVLIVSNHLTTTNNLCGWRKYAKYGLLCVKKFKISIFNQFFVFECLNMMNIVDYDRLSGSGLFDNCKLPTLMALLCKIWPNYVFKVEKNAHS